MKGLKSLLKIVPKIYKIDVKGLDDNSEYYHPFITLDKDSTFVDTSLTIKSDYIQNYLRKDRFGFLPFSNDGTPWHSCQYAALPEIYVQDASLEIAWSRLIFEKNTIAGENIIPFISKEFEGFDINEPEDLRLAEYYINHSKVSLPLIGISPYDVD